MVMELRAIFSLLVTCSFCISCSHAAGCVPVDFGHGATVCKCNDTYCDTIEPNNRLPAGEFAIYTTSQFGERLKKEIVHFTKANLSNNRPKIDGILLEVNRNKSYQMLWGVGGAVTDSAAINTMSLKPGAQELLLKSYFHQDGIEYSILRTPLASCDYSTRVYSYDDVDGDFELEHFSLQNEDLQFKIPMIRRAMNMSSRRINVFGSPWSSPAWMKTTGKMVGPGFLKGVAGDKYHKTWAQYYVKFIEEYKRNGVPIWGLTVVNEPGSGYDAAKSFQALGFNATMERDFVAMDLGPALEASGNGDLKLMIYDDQRGGMEDWVKQCLSNATSKYVNGIAVHWYQDDRYPAQILTDVHSQHPDKFILGTEACTGPAPQLGRWVWAERVANDILDDFNNWVSGWVYWNSVLDMEGGPSFCENHQGAPIIVDAAEDVFYKDTMYYALGHFSKFLPMGSRHIGLSAPYGVAHNYSATVKHAAFYVPADGSTVVIVSNSDDDDLPLHLADPQLGYSIQILRAHSITTFVWWSQ